MATQIITTPFAGHPAAHPAGDRERVLASVISGVGGTLRRRWLLLVTIAAVLMAAATVVILSMQPSYTATARVRVDPTLNPMAQDQSQSSLNAEAIETETGLMSSRALAAEVVRRMELYRDAEFAGDEAAATAAPDDAAFNRVVDEIRKRTSIGRDQLSYIISLNFKAAEPVKAAGIANAMIDTYIEMRVQSRAGTSERQADFFRQRLEELAQEVNLAESRLANYRASTGLPQDSGTGTVADQQIATLSMQLAEAEADAASARSNASVAQAQLGTGNVDAVAAVQGSNVIRDLRNQRAEIVRDMQEVEGRYGSRHPEALRVQEQLTGIDRQILDEGRRVVTSLQAQARAADAEVAALRSRMGSLEGTRARNTRNSAEAERLERDAASTRAQYDRMSELSLESTQTTGNDIAQVEVVDRAEPSFASGGLPRSLLLALAAIVSLAAGFAGVILVEMAQGGLRTIADFEGQLGIPLLASIPLEKGKRLAGRGSEAAPADSVAAENATLYIESIRNLRASIARASRSQPTQVIGFTSAAPGEGKTETALSYARLLAVNSGSVLLIDCDLRNGRLSSRLPNKSPVGLVEVLQQHKLEEALYPDDLAPGLDILPVSASFFTSQDLFGDERMNALLEQARARYSSIVLDLPPVLGVADARTVALLADGVCFLVRWGRTRPEAAVQAANLLASDGAKLLGGAYTMVEPTSEVMAGGYYASTYHKYFKG